MVIELTGALAPFSYLVGLCLHYINIRSSILSLFKKIILIRVHFILNLDQNSKLIYTTLTQLVEHKKIRLAAVDKSTKM